MPSKNFTLSRYFPEGTEYFYGYPAEEDSHFFNDVPPEVEELVAARPLTCAGPNVKTICFETNVEPFVWDLMHELGSLKCSKKNILVLPKEINNKVFGKTRNQLLRQGLVDLSSPGKLLMAQPFLDARLKNKFAIPSHRSVWLNDKRNLNSFIPWQYLAKTYDEFLDGMCFSDCVEQIPLPCVVKVSSSSSGDGVRICRTIKDIEKAKHTFGKLEGTILISELVAAVRNLGVQFGIPENPDLPPEIIMWHEQLTTKEGVFLGGIIEPNFEKTPEIKALENVILEKILPEVRRKGWFGIGGFDILMDKEKQFYVIDPNFRMTGMSVYDLLTRNGEIKQGSLSFMGSFEGTPKAFEKTMKELATVGSRNQKLHLTSLTQHEETFRFNAALLFDHRSELPKLAKEVLKKKIQSSVLENASRG